MRPQGMALGMKSTIWRSAICSDSFVDFWADTEPSRYCCNSTYFLTPSANGLNSFNWTPLAKADAATVRIENQHSRRIVIRPQIRSAFPQRAPEPLPSPRFQPSPSFLPHPTSHLQLSRPPRSLLF